jgi:dCMP deaminase
VDGRPSKDQYYLNIACEVCRRGACLRRQYGAVIVNDDQIVSTGYAGPPRGVANCVDLGLCLRQQMDIPAGQRYELCRSVHAEMNAVIHASRAQIIGGVLYLAGIEVVTGESTNHPEPCLLCRRVIINAGIVDVVIQPRGQGIIHLDPRQWIEQENQAARQGLILPKSMLPHPPRQRGGKP